MSGITQVAEVQIVPVGPRFDPRVLLMRPVRALRGGERSIAVSFRAVGPKIAIAVLSNVALDESEIDLAVTAARGMAAVDDDPTEAIAMLRGHPLLGPIIRRYDVRLSRTPTVFESFAEAVLAQLVTSQEAQEAWKRLRWTAGEPLVGLRMRAAPTATATLAVPVWKLHTLGIKARRLTTLREGAKRGTALERLAAQPPEAFMQKLMSLRGVGPWTANRVAKNALAHADAVPIADFHAPRFVTHALTGEEDGDDETMLAALAPFRPHRARVVRLLELAHLFGRGALGVRRRRQPKVDLHRREPWRF